MTPKPTKAESAQTALFSDGPEPGSPQVAKGMDVDAVFNAPVVEIVARAAATRARTEMDPETAEIQVRNMENGAGFEARKAERRVSQVRPGETAAEIAQNGITRARQVRESRGSGRPPTNLENRLRDRNLEEASYPNGEKGRPPATPTEPSALEPEALSPETMAAIQAAQDRNAARKAAELTSEKAYRVWELEFGDPSEFTDPPQRTP